MVLWGQISPQLLQKIMSFMVDDLKLYDADILDTAHIQKLAGLGTNGAHPNNTWAELKRMLPTPKLPKLHYMWLPMRHNVLGRFWKHVPMLLPHELFSAIYTHYPLIWTKIVCPGQQTVSRFWKAVQGSEQFRQHPVRSRRNYDTLCIPLKLHGDGTPVTGLGKGWGKLVDIFSLTSMLVCCPTIMQHLLAFMIFQHLESWTDGHHTLRTFYRKLIWSFQCLWEGKKPTKDWMGNAMVYAGAGDDLMGGHFMCLWALICDLEHCYKCYEMPNVNSNSPCGLCPCNTVGIPWFDFRPTAVWMTLVYTIQSYLAAGLRRSILFDIVGVSVLSFYPDYMHCKHFGIDKILAGSVLFLLVHFIMQSTDPDENLAMLWQDISRLYGELGTAHRYGHMRQTMFTTKSAPKLQGKAAEIKDFGPVMVELWKKYMNPRKTMHAQILIILEGSAHCDKILAEHPSDFALPPDAADDLISTCFIYLSAWYDVSMHFKNDEVPLFGMTAKAHLLMHSCLLSRCHIEMIGPLYNTCVLSLGLTDPI